MRVPIYGSALHIGIGKTPQECVDALPKRIGRRIELSAEDDEWDGDTVALGDGNFCILILDDGGISTETLFHETAHAGLLICRHHHVTVDSDNDEAFAYLQGWIGKQLMQKVEAYKARNKTSASRA